MRKVSYDHHAVTIDGKRTLLLSGAIHYPRSTPQMWPELFKLSRKAGLNAIETYVFWNFHEAKRGVYDFSGRLDLKRFCRMAQEHGLYVILRIGPFVCAEVNYGGFPFWLRNVPGIQMRTNNEPFKREMGKWVTFLCDYLRPEFYPNGGPIILTQVENEYNLIAKTYGAEGQKYLKWAVDLGIGQKLGIPWVMCFGGAPGAIETINDSYGHRQLERHFSEHPDQPAIWTENWQSWYDTYGYPHHVRPVEDTVYATARFFAGGGTGNNYYMWHGGTNFARETMYLQTTSYDCDAPMDEYGLVTTKYHHFSKLHHILTAYAKELLSRDVPKSQILGPKQSAYQYGPLAFLCNDDTAVADVRFHGKKYRLQGPSVVLTARGKILMDTARIPASSVVQRKMKPVAGALPAFVGWREPSEGSATAYTVNQPVDQLRFTEDETDYCWYKTEFTIPAGQAGEGRLRLRGTADVVYVYIDGKLKARTQGSLVEERGQLSGKNFTQEFNLNIPAGRHQLSLLCCGVGLIKGDWLIGGQNMVNERKGLWGTATWNGKRIGKTWQIQPGLVGEQCRVFGEAGDLIEWRAEKSVKPLTWLKTTFARPKGPGPWALDLAGMIKGMIWLNGRCLGRYWLAIGDGPTPDWPKQNGVRDQDRGEPTQRYYHIPASWLEDRNTLVLFEEVGGEPFSIKLCRRF